MSKKVLLVLAAGVSLLLLIFAFLCNYCWSQPFVADIFLSLFGSLVTAVIITSISLYRSYKGYIEEKDKDLFELKIYCDDLLSSMEVIYYSSFNKKSIPEVPKDITNKEFIDFAYKTITEAYVGHNWNGLFLYTYTNEHRKIINTASWIYTIAKRINNNKDYANIFSQEERNAALAIMNDSIDFSYSLNTGELVKPLKELFDCVIQFKGLNDYADEKYIKRDFKRIDEE